LGTKRTIGSPNAVVTLRAAETMWRVGGKDRVVASLLAWVLSEADIEHRLYAAELLANMGRNAEPAFPALAACLFRADELASLGEDERTLCLRCAEALGGIGRPAAETLSVLGTWLDVDDPKTRLAAACAIARINPSKARLVLPVLLDTLVAGDAAACCDALIAIRSLGSRAADAAVALAQVLDEVEADRHRGLLQHHAICALEKIGWQAADAVPALRRFLQTIGPDCDELRLSDGIHVCAALAAIGPAAGEAVTVLSDFLRLDHPGEFMRWLQLSASRALWQIQGDAGSALSIALNLLKSDEWWLRFHAAELLGDLGAQAKVAIPDLRQLMSDDDETVRDQAAESLHRIGIGS
jgi:hypothetical protein